ncbi:BON domain-containing protein [Chryseobacterium sp. MEBOG06]|uniref:BON domain-containing protein n=1 Tax=Chryseobacterium sp. MEBOG06 TaxID=2879938 RepID=UPI001F22E847|nr:BON domain-containing protein [Chryseobacterium sp. MEBOG06]UKB86031.1 BON domain-containing protein [Chryseobacterium sp. MEBOG06]
MKTNSELQKDVQNAIRWEPLLRSAEIRVTAKDGVVSLTGVVDSFTKKAEAEAAARKITGVKALVENIEVNLPNSWTKSDADIANEVLAALKSNYKVPDDQVSVKVEDGCVILGGELNWNYEKEAAKNAITFLPGIKVITNNITIKSEMHEEIDKKDIENALKSSVIDDRDIRVSVSGKIVTLEGTVNSWYAKEEVGHIVWKAPGILEVKNNLEVDYGYDY